MSKGGSKSAETVTQKTDVPDFLRPFVQQQAKIGTGALKRINQQLAGAGSKELVAGFDPLQRQAQKQAIGIAGGAGGFIPEAQQQFLQTAQGVPLSQTVDPTALAALQQTAGGEFLFGGQGFNQALEAAQRAVQGNILSTFGGAGRGTGGLAQTAIGQATADAFANQFGQERQRQLAAAGGLADLGQAERARQLGAAGALPGLGLLPSDILSGIGAERQGLAQRQLTAPISAQESILTAAGGGVPLQSLLGTQQVGQQPRGSPIAGGLSGGLGGALIGSQIGGPWGAAIGGGAGLLGGLFS